jgi:hypothetical protein
MITSHMAGGRARLKAASDQIEIVLRARGLVA